ncbi:ABC transporter permease subunit [Cellulomonas dongxiuzhuiae]|uniref:ABC transporter permease subunit n=1 Tax=Cellulomonas dongxiuzhuiae TaxID=2819979 RepID=UPI001AAF919C|nr:ABC transporter permease subunit [Cellulomonas dongxiuzhuiae]MBO3089168.1 ABC transporter permease subunit [Cellulomonas dongxiuzhuiae]
MTGADVRAAAVGAITRGTGPVPVELDKLVRRPATWVLATVWIVLGLVFGYLLPYLSFRGGTFGPATGGPSAEAVLAEALPASLSTTAVQGYPVFAGALALVLGALCTGSEYGWDTMKVLLTAGPSRNAVVVGKLVALCAVLGALVVASYAFDTAGALTVALVESRAAEWPGAQDLLVSAAAGWLVVTMWALAGALLGALTRGTAVAIGLGLVWSLAVENLVRGFAGVLPAADALQRFLPGTNAGSLIAALPTAGPGPVDSPGVVPVVSGTHALIVLLAYVAGFAALTLTLVRTRDVA